MKENDKKIKIPISAYYDNSGQIVYVYEKEFDTSDGEEDYLWDDE